ncbi:hypothetical protein Tco_1378227, partial [Tanacetum coccineum]
DSSRDDAEEEDVDDEDEEDEEEEEYLAPADFAAVASISLPPETEVERLLAITTLLPSPLASLSPPSVGERLARMTSTQALIDAVIAGLPSPLLLPLPPSLYTPPLVDHRDDIPKSELPPHNRLHLSTLCSRYEIGESSTARPTRGRDLAEAVSEITPVTIGEVSTRVVELAKVDEHDIQDVYALLEDVQDGRSRISRLVDKDSQRVDLLMGDRMTLQETVWMVEEEAYASREAWDHSI